MNPHAQDHLPKVTTTIVHCPSRRRRRRQNHHVRRIRHVHAHQSQLSRCPIINIIVVQQRRPNERMKRQRMGKVKRQQRRRRQSSVNERDTDLYRRRRRRCRHIRDVQCLPIRRPLAQRHRHRQLIRERVEKLFKNPNEKATTTRFATQF